MPRTDASASELLPWQQPTWDSLQLARQDGRLHHALLITGIPGVGKQAFARYLSQSLLCSQPLEGGQACGQCRNCQWLAADTHPDLHILGPDPDSASGEIKIDAVRALSHSETLSAQAGGYKITLVDPAENMNRYAANALLKTLEEPTSSSLFLLLSARPDALPATVRSRCQHVHLALPDEKLALNWLSSRCDASVDCLLALRLANGAPLAALNLMQSEMLAQREALLKDFLQLGRGRGKPVQTAAAWMKLDLPLLFEWMSAWVADMLRLGAGQSAVRLNNPDHAAALAEQAALGGSAALHRYWSRLIQARAQLSGSNFNPQLVLEQLLIHWQQIGARQSHGRT